MAGVLWCQEGSKARRKGGSIPAAVCADQVPLSVRGLQGVSSNLIQTIDTPTPNAHLKAAKGRFLSRGKWSCGEKDQKRDILLAVLTGKKRIER